MSVARIQLSGDNTQASSLELNDWLSREDKLRGHVSMDEPEPRPDEMGGISDVLVVALGAHGVGTVLASSLAVWIRHRRPSVDLEVSRSGGRKVKVSVRDADDGTLEAVLRQVLES